MKSPPQKKIPDSLIKHRDPFTQLLCRIVNNNVQLILLHQTRALSEISRHLPPCDDWVLSLGSSIRRSKYKNLDSEHELPRSVLELDASRTRSAILFLVDTGSISLQKA